MRLSFSNILTTSALINLASSDAVEGEGCLRDRDCLADLKCHYGTCTDYSQLLDFKTTGTCRAGSTENKFKMMSYNIFLLPCAINQGISDIFELKCESDQVHDIRIPKLINWFKDRDEDVIVMQEIFSQEEKIQEGMGEAGYCHHVTYGMNLGSGLGIFSKWPIERVDFVDFSDYYDGINEGLVDKGAMYAKINKNGQYYHVFNTHTRSNSSGDESARRREQFDVITDFVISENIPSDEMILLGGDFNEDKWHNGDATENISGPDYNTMLEILEAEEIKQRGPIKFSQDTERNNLLERMWIGDETWEEFAELLDYVFADKKGLIPDETSFCEIVIPQWPKGCNSAECMLSDHFPNTCTTYINGFFDNAEAEIPPPNVDDGNMKMWDGGNCRLDGDCTSDHCDWEFTCRPKMTNGETCLEDTACESSYCSTSFTCSDKSNGSTCNSDADCNSGRCTWSFQCEEKLQSGASCGGIHHNDGDCASGECSWSWKNWGWLCE